MRELTEDITSRIILHLIISNSESKHKLRIYENDVNDVLILNFKEEKHFFQDFNISIFVLLFVYFKNSFFQRENKNSLRKTRFHHFNVSPIKYLEPSFHSQIDQSGHQT